MWACVCVRVCVCVCERERERESVCVCVCVCINEHKEINPQQFFYIKRWFSPKPKDSGNFIISMECHNIKMNLIMCYSSLNYTTMKLKNENVINCCLALSTAVNSKRGHIFRSRIQVFFFLLLFFFSLIYSLQLLGCHRISLTRRNRKKGSFFRTHNICSICCILWLSVRQWSGRQGFNPRSHHTKDFKNGTWCLLA